LCAPGSTARRTHSPDRRERHGPIHAVAGGAKRRTHERVEGTELGGPHACWEVRSASARGRSRRRTWKGCRSLVTRLREAARAFTAGHPARTQLNEIADWIAQHQQDCYEEFWVESGAATFQPDEIAPGVPEFFPNHTWVLPSGAETTYIRNIELSLENPWITDVILPQDVGDRLTCESAEDNDHVSFLDHDPDLGFSYDLESGTVTVAGMWGEDFVMASAEFASADNDCDLCSFVSHDAAEGQIHALVLESEAPADVSWTTTELFQPERFRIALYAPIEVEQVGWEHYRAPAGSAMFVLSYLDGDFAPILIAENYTAIDIKRPVWEQPWEIQAFTIKYVDSSENEWGIYVSKLTFE
jgi:hypothetical protein